MRAERGLRMGILKCVCVSREKGAAAKNIHQGNLVANGLSGDRHCGIGHKQISILPYDEVKAYFEAKGEPVSYGIFGENLVVEGLDWSLLKPGVELCCGDAILEVTQVGITKTYPDAPEGICAAMKNFYAFCKVIHIGILTEEEPFTVS